MPVLIKAIILSFFIILINNHVNAANLSVELGKNSTGVAVGRDFGFGYGLVGLSAKFITDGPWSYVPTEEDLNSSCEYFESNEKGCEYKGRYYDGDEWEIFGKAGYKLPVVSIIYLNAGMGISKNRTTKLYLLKEDVKLTSGETVEFMETWGHVKENYYLNFIGGVSVEITRRMLLNIDYHTRQGLLSGLMWRF